VPTSSFQSVSLSPPGRDDAFATARERLDGCRARSWEQPEGDGRNGLAEHDRDIQVAPRSGQARQAVELAGQGSLLAAASGLVHRQ
jgi:hypothetical protein